MRVLQILQRRTQVGGVPGQMNRNAENPPINAQLFVRADPITVGS
jgi:hypothetical protein